jgi:hypothetical protein
MTADERDLTPEEEAELSRLLAAAGGPLATPPEVVARLDDVLAGLVAERARGAGAATTGGVSSLAAQAERRRRRWPKALLAAAAVVAGGYGVGAALTGTTMSGDAESAAGGSTSSDSDAGGAGDRPAPQGEPEAADSQLAEAPANATALRDAPPRLRSDHLAEDVVRVLDETGPARSGDTAVPKRVLVGAAAACLPSRLGPDESWYLVRYDGRRAALVAPRPEGGAVQASVLGCDGERLDSVTVPTG